MTVQLAVAPETAQPVDQVLGPLHREGRDDDVAAVVRGGAQDVLELLQRVIQRLVVAVAVGGLHQHHVRLVNGLGILHQR